MVDGGEPEELRAEGPSLCERHDGGGMGVGEAAGGCAATRPGPATRGRSARGAERGLLHSRDGVPVAGAAARPAATLDGARLFHPLAVRPDAGEVASRALRAGPGTGRQGGEPDHRDRRQPERQERGKGGKTPDPVGYDAGKKIKGRKRRAPLTGPHSLLRPYLLRVLGLPSGGQVNELSDKVCL